MKRILVIEDDHAMREALVKLLQSSGYSVLARATFAREDLVGQKFDCILLDLNLPEISGMQILQEIRQTLDVPVIMVTSSSSETDEALSMGFGADDYITKPYNPNILLLRIAAVLKRAQPSATDLITLHDLTIDFKRGVIERTGSTETTKRSALTKNEMIILRHLLDNRGKIVTRDALMTDLWNNHEYINDNALTVNISRLRSKLKSFDAEDALETRKGLGYIFHEEY